MGRVIPPRRVDDKPIVRFGATGYIQQYVVLAKRVILSRVFHSLERR
jgi:hypothetical protein